MLKRGNALLVAVLGVSGCVFITDEDQRAFVDADGDGVGQDADCDDTRAAVAPGLVEVCDGLDNDCNGTVDDGLYPDDDGDGYGGDPTGSACFADWVSTGDDCDDSHADVFPGQIEQCNGRDDSCVEGWTPASELGRVTWTVGTRVVDLSDAFVSVEPGVPATPELPTEGVLSICRADGDYGVRLWQAGIDQLAIVGVPIALPTDAPDTDPRPVLNGASSFDTGPVIDLSGASVSITGLQVRGGVATSVRGGGGLHLSELRSADLSDLHVYGNQAPEGSVGGAGLYLGGVLQADLVGVTLQDNVAGVDVSGGGGQFVDSTVRMVDSTVRSNTASGWGGGLAVSGGELRARTTTFEDNVSRRDGGGLYADDDARVFLELCPMVGNSAGLGGAIANLANVTCFGDDDTEARAPLLRDNHGTDGGAALMVAEAGYFSSWGCGISGSVTGPSDDPVRDELVAPYPDGYVVRALPDIDTALRIEGAFFSVLVDRTEGAMDIIEVPNPR